MVRVPEPVVQILGSENRLRQAGERGHDGGVVECRLACVLELAAALHLDGHFSGHHQQRRAVGLGRGGGGRHVAAAGAADPQRSAEAAAGAGIAVGHVDGAALVRRDHRREPVLPRERRQERIDQAARHHEQMGEPLLRQRVEDIVRAQRRAGTAGRRGRGHGYALSVR
jgi:hypothetical protein